MNKWTETLLILLMVILLVGVDIWIEVIYNILFKRQDWHEFWTGEK